METTNRRAFLKNAGRVAGMAGLVAGTAACPPVDPGTDPNTETPQWPLTYVPLDTERVRKLGHQAYYTGGCCYGAFHAVVAALREAAGSPSPFDTVITDMMRYGGGGAAGFGSLCGAPNGAAAAIGLVSDKATQNQLVSELLSWYASTPFPSAESNAYAVNHEFLVDPPKYDGTLPQSVAHGVLCHMSVTNWCLEAGLAESDAKRLERCARLTGDVAAKAAELLNAKHAGTFAAVTPLPSAAASCNACHTEQGVGGKLDFTNGKENCDLCHDLHS